MRPLAFLMFVVPHLQPVAGEPAVLVHDDKFLFVTCNQTTGSDHRQMTWLPGEGPGIVETNLKDPRYVDTVDLSLNPSPDVWN